MLELHQLRFTHPSSLRGAAHTWTFDLRAAAGSVTGVVGSSGCGKSTLLELIAGLLPADSGTLHWRGQDLHAMPAGLRPVSILFQQHNLFDHLSALDNVLLGHRGKLSAQVRQAAQLALEEMGLSAQMQQRAEQLSGGQQQRVALARTLLRQSQIVLLDEPFSALDDQTRENVRPLVRALADRHGCCVLMVTHDLRDCTAIAERTLQIHSGRLESSSDPSA